MHIQKGDYWICMNEKIYDVKEFLNQHPGGTKLLLSMCSKAPEYIQQQFIDKHTHSKAARNLLDMMVIGCLAPVDSI